MPQPLDGLVKRKVKTKRGSVVVYYWRHEVDGKDRRISLGSDYAVAKARLAEYRNNPPPVVIKMTSPAEPTLEQPLTFRSFSQRWLAEYAASKRTPRGRAQAEQQLRDYVWPIIGDVVLSELKPADLRRLNAELEVRKVGVTTRCRTLEVVSCCLNYAVDEAEVLDRSPWRKGMKPKSDETVPEPLTRLELAEVLRVAPEPWNSVIAFLAHTGLRWGEARALRWSDVRELPYRHLVVSRSHGKGTKSGKMRQVPLLPEALDVLESLTPGSGLIFSLPETASWIRRYVIEHSPVKGFHVHRLRHTFACRYLERGGSVEALRQILGHSTVALTERYGRLRPHAVAAEVRRIADGGTLTGTVTDLEGREARK